MNRITALDQCITLSQVITYINQSVYPENIAAKYAIDASEQSSNSNIAEEIEAHLDFLQEKGASFSFSEAFEIARKAQ